MKIGAYHKEIFDYIGVHLQQNTDSSIILDQSQYINTINLIPISPDQSRYRSRPLSKEEITLLRRAPGELIWIAGMTRPEITFHVCEISTKIKTATISDIISLNKVIKFIKSAPSHIKIPSLDLDSLEMYLYSDISFNNLPDGGSHGGYIVFICDKNNKSAPIAWNSSKLNIVSHSTLAAETLAFSDGCDTAFFIQILLKENIFMTSSCHTSIQVFTNNQRLHDAVKTKNLNLDQHLGVHEMTEMRDV